jgi:uncharacterized protein YbjT (DUF2867 family)
MRSGFPHSLRSSAVCALIWPSEGIDSLIERKKIVITGAAGLVGQNLVALLAERNDLALVAIDKHAYNLGVLRRRHPEVTSVEADLAETGPWQGILTGATSLVQLHAQIAGKTADAFISNNVTATRNVLEACRQANVPFVVHVSSSVVRSTADDPYTRTKRVQEDMVRDSGIAHCILRPTLMFGWFDPKHLGWLARFLERAPLFPVPGHGRYMRQPLYIRDFCRIVAVCLERRPHGSVFDLVGRERIDYIDIIRAIRKAKGLSTPIVGIPVGLFSLLLRTYALFSARPPFTADQLKALVAGDVFQGVDIETTFGIKPTPFGEAIRETFTHPVFSHVFVEPNI